MSVHQRGNNIWIVTHCPSCGQKNGVSVVKLADAIEHESPIACIACRKDYYVMVTCQIRDAQLRIGAEAVGQPFPSRIFSGENSRDIWQAISRAKTKKDLQSTLYLVCCRLQELEARIEQSGKG